MSKQMHVTSNAIPCRRIVSIRSCILIVTLLLAASYLSSALAAPPIRDSQHIASKYVCSWKSLKERNVVMQKRDYSCGAAALATVIKFYIGDPMNEGVILRTLDGLLTFEEVKDRIENGLAMSDLRKAAVELSYQSVVAQMSLEQLFESKVPLVVGITENEYKHFVVYRGTDYQYVYLADPIRGNIRLLINDFACQWQKNLALAVAKPGVPPRLVSPLSLTARDIFLGQTNDQLLRTIPSRGAGKNARQGL
ncbi:C39 family peptidase [Bythopirellula polymerisocia]|uniref:Lactococcin-G-processing and transport ATP-binding protein LagD n=1 Tax=Bythopirellula polymerisocia TaxID=2528003 RepID=A0A5C6CM13_9BACT|nr:cysteine peptidase family C39 domain-containing protein [Bythopirellula polymerisocia]TWU25963.1 Lactococcin-G-processing and transport ATP-binding protein LagD [Bythopirellula polymerisocia]